MEMPWGKHKGEKINGLSDSYLRWLTENCEDDEIRDYAEEVLSFRSDERPKF